MMKMIFEDYFKPYNKNLIFLLLFISYGFLCWYPMLNGVWGPSDDHEIINYLGPDHKLFFHELFQLFQQSEAWSGFSEIRPRFRPNFYYIRIIETFFYEDNLALWYSTRIILFSVFIFSLFLFLRKYFGFLTAIFFVSIELLFPYWKDLVTRLGIAESYALLGMSLIFLSFLNKNEYRNNLSIFLALFGVFLCVGIKENFIYLMIIPITILFYFRKENSKLSIAACYLTLIYCCYVLIGIILVLFLNSGLDEYNQTILQRFFLINKIFSTYFITWSLICFLYLFSKKKDIYNFLLKPLGNIQWESNKWIFVLFFYFIYIFSFFFFAGNFPNSTRYDFPALLLSHFSILLILSDIKFFKKIKLAKKSFYFLIFLLVFILLINFFFQRFYSMKALFRQYNFMDAVSNAHEYLSENPNSTFIIKSYCGGTEHAASVFSLIRNYYKHNNPIMLLIDSHPNKSCGGSGKDYFIPDPVMLKIQLEGNQDYLKFDPNSIEKCFSIGLDGQYYDACEGSVFYRKMNINFEKYKFNIKDIFRGSLE